MVGKSRTGDADNVSLRDEILCFGFSEIAFLWILLNHPKVFRRLPISCLPTRIPVRVEHDVTSMGLDDHVSVSGLSLPEGVTVRLPENQTVCAVVAEKKVVEEVAAEETEGGEAPAEGAAPAASG